MKTLLILLLLISSNIVAADVDWGGHLPTGIITEIIPTTIIKGGQTATPVVYQTPPKEIQLYCRTFSGHIITLVINYKLLKDSVYLRQTGTGFNDNAIKTELYKIDVELKYLSETSFSVRVIDVGYLYNNVWNSRPNVNEYSIVAIVLKR